MEIRAARRRARTPLTSVEATSAFVCHEDAIFEDLTAPDAPVFAAA
jgi:hypothetical protein